MDSDKNGRWIIPFKKFGRLRVNIINNTVEQKETFLFDL